MISEVMTAVEVRHLESTVYGEMDNKKKIFHQDHSEMGL